MRFRDVEEAFENAIKNGIEEVEKYMYMFSDDRFDYFKHMETREYEKVMIGKERQLVVKS